MSTATPEAAVAEHPVRPEYIARLTPAAAQEIDKAWRDVAGQELYGEGITLLSPYADGNDLPQNVVDFETARRTLPEPQQSLIRPAFAMWAHLAHLHGHVLTEEQRVAITAPWSKLAALAGPGVDASNAE